MASMCHSRTVLLQITFLVLAKVRTLAKVRVFYGTTQHNNSKNKSDGIEGISKHIARF